MRPLTRREFGRLSFGLSVAGLAVPRVAARALAAPARPQRILVIGAGLAGMSAAYELLQRGHEVTVLEAQLRPGGRVLTIREPFADGLYGEAGAGRIPRSHDLVWRYLELFELPKLEPFYPTQLDSVDFIHGRSVRRPATGDADLSRYDLKLTDEEKQLGLSGLSAKHVKPVLDQLGDVKGPNWPTPALKKYDDMTWTELRRQMGYSPAMVDLTSVGSANMGQRPSSALYVLRQMALQAGAPLFRIPGGMDQFPRAFARRLAPNIRYGCQVVRIEQDAREVRLRYRRAGGTETETIAGDRLVSSVPFSVLRQLEVVPAFSAAKSEVIRELPYASVTRVLLQVRRGPWLPDGLSGYARTDFPCEIWQPTFDRPGPRAMLVIYVKGDAAARLASMGEAERVRAVVEHVDQVFPGLRGFVENGVTKCWDEDPWACGAYGSFAPGQMLRLVPHLASVEGRVHFAGDHTSPWVGWMQGALHSGNRVAREIEEAAAV